VIVDDTILQFIDTSQPATLFTAREEPRQRRETAPVEQADESLEARLKRARAGLYGDKSAIRAKAAAVRGDDCEPTCLGACQRSRGPSGGVKTM
jgi:hypothetical protein